VKSVTQVAVVFDKQHKSPIFVLRQITTLNIKIIKTSKLIMCSLGCVCIGLVEHPLLLLSISLACVAPASEHSNYPYMDTTHCYQHSFYSLQVLSAFLLQPVALLIPLDAPLSLPEHICFCKVPESWPYSAQHFVNASKTALQTLSALLSICQRRVALKWEHRQLMLQYSCTEPFDEIEVML
jgi:hypothetical protein